MRMVLFARGKKTTLMGFTYFFTRAWNVVNNLEMAVTFILPFQSVSLKRDLSVCLWPL